MRVGFGYDVHRFADNRPFVLGGVIIPYEKGLYGHSDADVLAHAVIDALFGAAALGDIGSHFPDTDEQYRDADSMLLLDRAVRLLREKGYRVVNVDTTVVCQKPKIAPYIGQIRETLARHLSLCIDCVSVKGKTEEGLGFTGNGEGVKAYAVCGIEYD